MSAGSQLDTRIHQYPRTPHFDEPAPPRQSPHDIRARRRETRNRRKRPASRVKVITNFFNHGFHGLTRIAEKSRSKFAARMERLFCKSPRKQACRCLFKNPAIPASRACPEFFLDANFRQLFISRSARRSRAARDASERAMCLHNPVQAGL